MLAKARVRRRLRGGEGGRLSRCRAFHTCISRFSLRTSTGRPISLCVVGSASLLRAGPAADRVTVDENCGPTWYAPETSNVGMRMSKASTIQTQTGTAVVLEETLLRIDLNRYA